MKRAILIAAWLAISVVCADAQAVLYKQSLYGQPTGGCSSAAPLPADTGPTFSAAFGTCALTTRWMSGKLFDVTAQSRTVTIRAINGYPDVKTLAALMGISPLSGIGGLPMSLWYDQSGSGNNCVQATSGAQLSVWLINGKIYVAGDGMIVDFINGAAGSERYCSVSSITTNNQSTSVFAVSQINIAGNQFGLAGTYSSALFNLSPSGPGSGEGFIFGASYSSGATAIRWAATNWVNFGATTSGFFPESQPVVLGVIAGASSLTLTQNEETPTSGTAIGSGTATGATIMGCTFGAACGFYGRTQAILIAGATAFSSGQQQTERNSLYARFNVAPAPAYSVLVDGASTDSGEGAYIGAVMGYGWAAQLRDMVPYPIRWGNTSVPGASLENLTTNFATNQAGFFSGLAIKNLLFIGVEAAGNSIANGDSAAQAYSALGTYVNAAVTAGWSKANIYTSSFSYSQTATTTAYDVLLAANTIGINAITFDGTGTVCPTNATFLAGPPGAPYFNPNSGVSANHPLVPGYNVFAKCFWPQVIQQGIPPAPPATGCNGTFDFSTGCTLGKIP